MQECSQKPAMAGCLYKSGEVGFFGQQRRERAWLDLITSFREVNSSSSYAERLQVQSEHENRLKQLFQEMYTSPHYYWACSYV